MAGLQEAERRFVLAHRVARLATADASRAPHVVPVCFALDGETVYTAIDEKPKAGNPLKRLRNIAANPRAALLFDRYDEDWAKLGWVKLQGRAEVLHQGEEHDLAVRFLKVRYPQYAQMTLSPVIAIRIERVTCWGDLATSDGT